MEELYASVIEALRTSAALEKHAAADSRALDQKTTHDWHLFQRLKEAGWKEVASKVMAHPVGKGLAYSAGAAVPVGALGSYVIGRAGQEERDTIADLRNKALQTALGIGAIGAGLYGMHRMSQQPQAQPQQKYGAAIDETLSKLATTALLDELLAEHPQNEKIAELRLLNAEHGVDILRQLLV